MRSLQSLLFVLLAAGGMLWFGQASLAQEETKQKGDDQKSANAKQVEPVVATKTYRSSTLAGLKVRNPEGEELGEIHDLVIDMEKREVRYAALSFGGFLGVGDKLFAVPIEALKLKHDEKDKYFVLDVDKQKLKNAPGFSKKMWPDVADPKWAAGVDEFYGMHKHQKLEGKIESTAEGELAITDEAGEKHSFKVGPEVQFTMNGKSADFDDLKKGHHAKVTTVERAGKKVVTAIEAHSSKSTARKRTDELKK